MNGITRSSIFYLLLGAAVFYLSSFSLEAQSTRFPLKLFEDNASEYYRQADSIMSTMSLEEKIAQCMMPMVVPTSDPNALKKWEDLIDNKLGGVLFRGGNAYHQLSMTNTMRKKAKTPMMVAFDGEWGLAMRLQGTTRYPKSMLLGAVNDSTLMREYGKMVAGEAKQMGVHVMFAPVLDVNTNPANPVIGVRSFGEHPHQVACLGIAYSEGLEAEGVLSCAKHFPGHGDTHIDSHEALATVSASREVLDDTALVPFKAYSRAGMGSMMVGHLLVPALSSISAPASLNKDISTRLLREELLFDGLLFTDALEMKGAKENKNINVALEAFKAGADILLGSNTPITDIQTISDAVKRREVAGSVVEERCRRVLAFKIALGCMDRKILPSNRLLKRLHSQQAVALSRKMHSLGMTLVKNDGSLPIRPTDRKKLVLVVEGEESLMNRFFQYIPRSIISKKVLLSKGDALQMISKIASEASENEIVLLVLSGKSIVNREALDLLVSKRKTVVAVMGTPYLLNSTPLLCKKASVICIGYEDTAMACRAMADAITGVIPFRGTLPVSIDALKNQ
ncbi:MAG: glycoside hydrolase family 3 N-terminal domain-containing protein [Porphyromonas sp.]|nr:glycoside hydrolase family 3 N-terminal domain-containing protein [Porphyromonas sp.]